MSTQIKTDIRKLDFEDVVEYMEAHRLPKFKARQIWHWLWQKSKYSFDDMVNLPKKLIEQLNRDFEIKTMSVDTVQKSSDGTIKSRLKLHDGHMIEAVLIPVERDNRYTVCVSSQVGCSLDCKFCATGKMDRIRNLDPSEIYDQFIIVNNQCQENYNHPLTNVVFMGMGEPLLNYKNVLKGIDYICGVDGLNFSYKRITVSTVGLNKMIKKLADDGVKFNLALSLHAPDDIKRSEIMPINDQNDIGGLMEALRYFYNKTKNKISFEYICLNGFNDTYLDAINLSKLITDFPIKVNIIEYNPIDGANFVKSNAGSIDNFAKVLRQKGLMVTVRRSRGKDIDAACGQLANKS